MKIVLESFGSSFGILLFGFITIPLAARAVGGELSMAQGAGMSGLFFIARWIFFYYWRKAWSVIDKIDNPSIVEIYKHVIKRSP